MKNTYSIVVVSPFGKTRAYVRARRVTSAIRLVLESEKCGFSSVRSIERL